MSERLTQHQSTAVGVALLIGAGLTTVGAIQYADKHRIEFDQPSQEPEYDPEPYQTQTPEKLPTPQISPSAIELPTINSQIFSHAVTKAN